MTREARLALKQDRLKRLENSNKNVKCGGVVRRLKREVRNLSK